MKISKLVCLETNKRTRINLENVPDYETDDVLDNAANRLLKREPEHKYDFVCITRDNLQSEICHALGDLTEHTGEYRSFEVV